jgi:hypothetical protein
VQKKHDGISQIKYMMVLHRSDMCSQPYQSDCSTLKIVFIVVLHLAPLNEMCSLQKVILLPYWSSL